MSREPEIAVPARIVLLRGALGNHHRADPSPYSALDCGHHRHRRLPDRRAYVGLAAPTPDRAQVLGNLGRRIARRPHRRDDRFDVGPVILERWHGYTASFSS